jgi:hypothetical protein
MKSLSVALIVALLSSETQAVQNLNSQQLSINIDSLVVKTGEGEGGNAKTMSKTIVTGNFANINCASQCCACSGSSCGGCDCPCTGGASAGPAGGQSIERIVADAIGEKKEIEKMVDRFREVMKGGDTDKAISDAKDAAEKAKDAADDAKDDAGAKKVADAAGKAADTIGKAGKDAADAAGKDGKKEEKKAL